MNGKINHPQGGNVFLWKSPAFKPEQRRPSDMTGAVYHGQEVEIVKEQKFKGIEFLKVKCVVKFKDEEYPQHGWVMASFVER